MRGKLTYRRLIVAFCLVLFQVQLLAASTLGCLNDNGGAVSGGCPFHVPAQADRYAADAATLDVASSVAPMPADADLLDCPKCALNLGLHYAVAVPVVTIASTPQHANGQPSPELHFYRFTPKQTKKPPIPADF
jgi:hypothetical protein